METQILEKNKPQMANMDIAQALKTFTQTHHHQIEQNPLTQAIVNQTITAENYQILLQKFLGYYTVIEQALQKINDWEKFGFDIKSRMKANWLKEDLLKLGKTKESIEQIAHCNNIPNIQNMAEALGVLYVLEGSTLGGQILQRHLANALNLNTENGARFFGGYGKTEIRDKWVAFQKLLTDFDKKFPQDKQKIVNTAIATFQTMDNWLKS